MAREILLSKKTEQGLRLDPRTKLLLIFIISIFVMGGTGGEAMGLIRLVLCTVPAILLLTSKQCAKAVGYIAVFSAFFAVQIYVLPHLTGILNFLVLFTTGFFCRILPSVAIAAYAVKTTTVSELISGMERIHMPKEVLSTPVNSTLSLEGFMPPRSSSDTPAELAFESATVFVAWPM